MPDLGAGGNSGGPLGRRIHLLLLEEEKEADETDVALAKLKKACQALPKGQSIPLVKQVNLLIRKRRRRRVRLKNIRNLFSQYIRV